MAVVLFDGECSFCQHSVQFIIKRDPKKHFQFASLQSDIGRQLIEKVQAPRSIDSLLVIDDQTYYTKSSAALFICKKLTKAWKIVYLLIAVPKPIRDGVYNFVATHRYKWFGKKKHCILPSAEDRKRFL